VSIKSFQEKATFHSAYVKRKKIGAKISLLAKLFLSFFAQPIKMLVFYDIGFEHIEYGDTHADFSYFLTF
jgi:hypothetical protein